MEQTSAEPEALEAFRAETAALAEALSPLGEADWARPTRCAPWSVRELLGHVAMTVGRLQPMLEGPAPAQAEVDAARYYRPDARFSPQTNATRIDAARSHAAEHADGPGLAAAFAEVSQSAYRLCRAEPAGRVVLTRHGDPMLLSDFLTTRVVEVAVHGLDIADALDRDPWLTPQAEESVLGLVVGPAYRDHLRELAWDGPTAVRKVTGRAVLSSTEEGVIDRLGISWLTLG